jgi:hypothetical protein
LTFAFGKAKVAIFANFRQWSVFYSSGPNPATSLYNASVVKIYSATNSMARFYNKKLF